MQEARIWKRNNKPLAAFIADLIANKFKIIAVIPVKYDCSMSNTQELWEALVIVDNIVPFTEGMEEEFKELLNKTEDYVQA